MLNESRLLQLKDLLRERGWDFLLLYGHPWRKDFFRSLFNMNFSGPHAAAVITQGGEVTVLLSDPWDYENASAARRSPVSFEPDFGKGLRRWVEKCTVQSGGNGAVAGMEFLEARHFDAVREGAGGEPSSATADVEELRRMKTPEEMACLQKAADLADRGYAHFAEVIELGMAEYELVAEVEAFLKSNGAEDNFMLIASGGTEVTGMKPPTDRRFQKGDQVTTELTPQVNGYWAQICRTLIIGEPSAEQRRAYSIFAEAQQAALDLLRPGVDIAAVARVQNDVFRKHGFGDYTGPKYTRVRGHGLGLHLDENPYILEDVHYTVKEGMVLIAHPNTYLPLSGYMVFGDTLAVTRDRCMTMNHTEKKLFQKDC
jgi:Xaa-Pro aminopeptidase